MSTLKSVEMPFDNGTFTLYLEPAADGSIVIFTEGGFSRTAVPGDSLHEIVMELTQATAL